MNADIEHINIFIAYSRKDAKYMDKLRTHLTPLELSGAAKIWCDGEIAPGTNWEEEIKKYLFSADITLLLISANSFNSDYFYHEEMAKALQRHQEEEAIVIPVILSDCIWEITELKHLQALPKDGEPIDHWSKEDSAYADIVRGVYKSVELIRDRRNQIKIEREAKEKEKLEKERLLKEGEIVETVSIHIPKTMGDDYKGDLGSRNILRRPNLSSIIRQNGRIVIYVCADKYGRVVKAQAVMSQSTIKDKKTLLMAAGMVKNEMRFSPGKGTDCMYYKIRIQGVD